MTEKWSLIIDIARCNGCYNCALAAKDEYVDHGEPGYFAPMPRHGQEWVDVIHHERGQFPAIDVAYVPTLCGHCADAPCVKAARDGAAYQRADGIVIIDPAKARGQKQIVEACPYGAAFWNEALQIPQAWPFDAHLLDRGWKAPRMVEVCATGAIEAVKISEPALAARAARENLRVLHPEFGVKSRVYYKNLDRVEKCFVAGSAVFSSHGVVDCAIGAKVLLQGDGRALSAETDDFGDFRFDGLPPGAGPFEISVEGAQGRATARVERLDGAVYVGRLTLAA